MNISLRNSSFRYVTSRGIGRPLFLAAFALVALCLLGRLSNVLPVHAQAAVPFTMTTESHSYFQSSKGKLFLKETKARRSNGATAQINADSLHPKAHMRNIYFPDGRALTVYDLIHGVIKWPPSLKSVAYQKEQLSNHPSDCRVDAGEYVAGRGVLMGENVVVLKMLPKGSSGMTWWRAPKLGCEVLQSQMTQVQSDGTFRLVSETKLVSLKTGAPDSALFDVPAGYRSLSPSQAQKEMAAKLGLPWTKEMARRAQKQNAMYYGRRK
ncbi:MAG: hypothetical protein ACRD4V_00770 [Candidatus Acidiferrales bacterium]